MGIELNKKVGGYPPTFLICLAWLAGGDFLSTAAKTVNQ